MISPKLRVIGAVGILWGFSACVVQEDLSTAESEIIGGTPTSDRPEVGKVIFTWGGEDHHCTATLISPSTFVTAAHCIGWAPVFYGGTITLVGALGTVPIRRTFSQSGNLAGQPGYDDIAVGRLASSVTSVTPATISTTQPNNTYLTAIGYGCVDIEDGNSCTYGRTYKTYYYDGGDSDFRAPVDSGGPTFLGGLNDGGAIVRVHSGESPWPYSNDLGADAVAYRDHIWGLSTALTNTGISYRSQLQGLGWTPAVANGVTSGTTGQSRRLEGIQLWTQNKAANVCYTAYVEDVGWQPEVCSGQLAGTVGQAKRMEAIKIRYAATSYTQQAEYRVYLQDLGWQGWVRQNAVAGTTGQSRRIEAIQVRQITVTL